MTHPLTIHRDVHSMSAVIADFRASVAVSAPARPSGLCGFDGFIDTFVRSGRSPSFADMVKLLDAWAGVTLGDRV